MTSTPGVWLACTPTWEKRELRFDVARPVRCIRGNTDKSMKTSISRRSAVKHVAAASVVAAAASSLAQRLFAADAAAPGMKGRINHSVCKWCYPRISLEDLCVAGKGMGLTSIELLNPPYFPTLKKHD